jgi:hypothetical protein
MWILKEDSETDRRHYRGIRLVGLRKTTGDQSELLMSWHLLNKYQKWYGFERLVLPTNILLVLL